MKKTMQNTEWTENITDEKRSIIATFPQQNIVSFKTAQNFFFLARNEIILEGLKT